MAIYFCAYAMSAFLVLLTLKRRDHLPTGLIPLFAFSALSMGSLSVLSLWRGLRGDTALATLIMALIFVFTATGLYLFGRRYRWLPPRSLFVRLLTKLPPQLQWGGRRV